MVSTIVYMFAIIVTTIIIIINDNHYCQHHYIFSPQDNPAVVNICKRPLSRELLVVLYEAILDYQRSK